MENVNLMLCKDLLKVVLAAEAQEEWENNQEKQPAPNLCEDFTLEKVKCDFFPRYVKLSLWASSGLECF